MNSAMTTNSTSKTLERPNSSWLSTDPSFATKAIHTEHSNTAGKSGAIVPPISLSMSLKQNLRGQNPNLEDNDPTASTGNSTQYVLETTIAALDGGKYAFVFASGMAAIYNVMSLLRRGDGVVLCEDIYSGTARIFKNFATSFGITVEFKDLSSDVLTLNDVLKPNTKLVWIETPTNPTLKIVNIPKVVEIVRQYSKDILVAVDNTFLTSYFQRPLTLGADIVVYSLSKFMNGMSDVLMGAVVTSREDLENELRNLQNSLGALPSPLDCYLVLRSLKTLHIRLPQHMSNSLGIAKFLEGHPKVKKVLHPGLPSHPQHSVALKQSSGHSGLISFYTKEESAEGFLSRLRIFKTAVSLGGAESMASIPSLMTHALIPDEMKTILEITDNMVRLSIGLESLTDLVQDLDQALNK